MSGSVGTQKTIYDLSNYEKRLNLNDSFLTTFKTSNDLLMDGYKIEVARQNTLPAIIRGTINYGKGNNVPLDSKTPINMTPLSRYETASWLETQLVSYVPRQVQESFKKDNFNQDWDSYVLQLQEDAANLIIRKCLINPIDADTEIDISLPKYEYFTRLTTGSPRPSFLGNGATVKKLTAEDILEVQTKIQMQNSNGGAINWLIDPKTALEIKKENTWKEYYNVTGKPFSWGLQEAFSAYGCNFWVRSDVSKNAVYKKTAANTYIGQADGSLITADSREAFLVWQDGALIAGRSPLKLWNNTMNAQYGTNEQRMAQMAVTAWKSRYDQVGCCIVISGE
jgi:hypothetical protein